MLTIDKFWKPRLAQALKPSAIDRPGWSVGEVELPTFLEAPLTLSEELPGDDAKTSSIILVSAPGAVGKSTLSRQIAAATGAIYIDLAKAAPVGGDTISGGLAKSGLFANWQKDEVALLIDGLDEARLKVTQEAFAAFLQDISEISAGRKIPTTLFGRTGAVQDAWLIFSDKGVSAPVLEIGFYSPEAAVDFTMAVVASENNDAAHRGVEREAATLLLSRIREQTKSDGDRFAGYAPVLQAVARRILAETNASSLVAEIKQGSQPVTLQTVISSILERERRKLAPIHFQDASLAEKLYLPEEQLSRLVARLYGTALPATPPMSPQDSQTYTNALEGWVPDHPFINGAKEASSAVFDAVIVAHALHGNAPDSKVLQRELERGSAANPFLAEFYLPNQDKQKDEAAFVPPEHIGILYSSLRARLSLGDTANLTIDGADELKDESSLAAEVEITLSRGDKAQANARVLSLTTEQAGTFRLGSYIGGMNLDIPLSKVEIGPATEATIFAPISIQCNELTLTAGKLFIEAASDKRQSIVYLAANKFSQVDAGTVPQLRGEVRLNVQWPGATGYPWTSFVVAPVADEDPRLSEALRRFRKFVISFRSHSKGELARYAGKLEHERMTKGTGQAVLDYMKEKGIISMRSAADPMYILDPDRLGEISGATYAQCMSQEFSPQTIEFIRAAIQ